MTSVICSVLLLALSAGAATVPATETSAPETPSFATLPEFVIWLDGRLEADDYAGIVAAQTDTMSPKESSLGYAKALDERTKEGSLAKLYEGRQFPNDKDTLKLGGHDQELGHIHIDLVRAGDTWKLARIWVCR